MKWYILRAVSGQEKKVKDLIEKEIVIQKLENYFSQIIIPMEKVLEVTKDGKKRVKEKSLMPGYMLIEAELQPEVLLTIKSVTGAINFLGTEKGGNPTPLRQSEVDEILGKVEKSKNDEMPIGHTFMVGDTVKILEGQFLGFVGTVEEIDEEKRKLKVMVKIFSRNLPIDFNFTQVIKDENGKAD